jgi:tetratricopeptide (TPR) repeat protein
VSRHFHRWITALAVFSTPILAAPAPGWRLARSPHFEIYAQSSDQRARAMLVWFEQLRAFFEQQRGWKANASPPVRVIVFASEQEYQPYRLRSASDAYYVGSGSQDYIVLSTDDPAKLGQAAHEYAHLVLRASGGRLAPWLKEGLAEFFATLHITDHAAELGGVLPGRIQTLEKRTWMPLAELMSLSEAAQQSQERSAADLFYAESWALADMLALSPEHAPGFQKFLALAGSGSPGLDALMSTYGKSADAITRDLRNWLNQRTLPVIQLPEVVIGSVPVEVSDVSPIVSRLLLAQVLLAAGEFDRAERAFTALAHDAPDSPEVSAALGMIALHQGDSEGAGRAWKRAIRQGIRDPMLCYNYAVLADQAGVPADDIRPVLERAVALRPDFDDAHYQLALLEKNARHFEAALEQFHALRMVPDTRAYAYWLALADTFNELGRRDEAQSAARHASEHAVTSAEHARAAEEIYVAQTDPGVQFARDASGHLQLVTTRMPHQQSDWNPFVEPGDDMHRVQGTLREIDCGKLTTIHVEAAGNQIALAIPDLQHVQMRHAPQEFVCGPQLPAPAVSVDYARVKKAATEGVVRGMDFNPASVSRASAP